MADSEHNFRYLVKPGGDFRFTQRMRLWGIISLLLCSAAIGSLFLNKAVRGDYLNWTIDFKGGTEIVYAFVSQEQPGTYVAADPARVRTALQQATGGGFSVSDYRFQKEVAPGREVTVPGVTVRTTRFGAMTPESAEAARAAIEERFADRGVQKVSWSGDRVFVRSHQLIDEAEMGELLAGQDLELKPVEAGQAVLNTTPNEDTGEYNASFTVYGLDRQYEVALAAALEGLDVETVQSHGVGAKAGEKLRNDGIKSIFYAMLLIVLYLAFRFDIRYAPGAVVATLHDAIIVLGVFSVTWTEVSLTSVAALLTVMGYSVNDTVVVFDRIRENMAKLKDKKVERIVDISLNEILVRSVMTSLTLFVVTLMMNIFGTGLVRNFAFAMNAGIVVGTYSSLFLAAPIFIWIHRRWYSGPSPKPRRAAAVAP
jgi:preprotein translocase subunit SecF